MKEQPHAPVYAVGHPAGKEEDLGVLVDTGLEHELAVDPCSQEGEWHPGMHYTKYYQVGEGGDHSPYTVPVRPHLESCVCFWASVQERYGHTGESPRKRPTKAAEESAVFL